MSANPQWKYRTPRQPTPEVLAALERVVDVREKIEAQLERLGELGRSLIFHRMVKPMKEETVAPEDADRVITWTGDRVRALRRCYREAVKDGRDSFTMAIQGAPATFLVCYAKYLIQYLVGQFGPDNRQCGGPLKEIET